VRLTQLVQEGCGHLLHAKLDETRAQDVAYREYKRSAMGACQFGFGLKVWFSACWTTGERKTILSPGPCYVRAGVALQEPGDRTSRSGLYGSAPLHPDPLPTGEWTRVGFDAQQPEGLTDHVDRIQLEISTKMPNL
jgi:hypothetical protein